MENSKPAPLERPLTVKESVNGFISAALLLLVVCTQLIEGDIGITKTTLLLKFVIIFLAIRQLSKINDDLFKSVIYFSVFIFSIIELNSLFDKSLSKPAVLIAPIFLRYLPQNVLSVSAVFISIFLLSSAIGSRTLSLTAVFFIVVYLVRFKNIRIMLLMGIPFLYIGISAYIGSKIDIGDPFLVDASRSNVARTVMIYGVLELMFNFKNFLLGHPSIETFNYSITDMSRAVHHSVYSDPHNIFISSFLWGGVINLSIIVVIWFKTCHNVLSVKKVKPWRVFILCVIAIHLSVATMSLFNTLILIGLIIYVQEGKEVAC
jgi:hypothetical protein